MANIFYRTDYYTNVYLLYLDGVPMSEVVPVDPAAVTAEGEPTLYEAVEFAVTTERGTTLATATSPVRTGAPSIDRGGSGYGGR